MCKKNNIINESQLRQLFNGCGFTHAIIKKRDGRNLNRQMQDERSSTIINCIKISERPTRFFIADYLSISMPTLSKFLNPLITDGTIEKTVIGGKGSQCYFTVADKVPVKQVKNPKPKTITLVVNALKGCKEIKRVDVIEKTGLSKCTIKAVMAKFIEQGIVIENHVQIGRDKWSVYTSTNGEFQC